MPEVDELYTVRNPGLYHDEVLDRGSAPATFDIWDGFTISLWYKPFLMNFQNAYLFGNFDDFNGLYSPGDGRTYEREMGGYYLNWSTIYGGTQQLGFWWMHSAGGGGPWAGGDATSDFLIFDEDPAFGEAPSEPDLGPEQTSWPLASAFNFLCVRVSKRYAGTTEEGHFEIGPGWSPYTGDLMDIDIWRGNSITGEFRRLTDSDMNPSGGFGRTTMIGLPAILGFTNRGTNPNNYTHFTVFGYAANETQIQNCGYGWSSSHGVMDEFRFYERVLTEAEVAGLYMIGCGSQPHTQACDQIYDNIVGAGVSGPASQQSECGGVDPFALLYGINNLI